MRSFILKHIDAQLIRLGKSPAKCIGQFLFAIIFLAGICTILTYMFR